MSLSYSFIFTFFYALLVIHDSLLLPFMGPEGSSQSSQGSATSPHSKPHEFNSSFNVLFLMSILKLSCHL